MGGGVLYFFSISNWENRSNVMSTESNIRSSMSSCLVFYSVRVGALDLPRC